MSVWIDRVMLAFISVRRQGAQGVRSGNEARRFTSSSKVSTFIYLYDSGSIAVGWVKGV